MRTTFIAILGMLLLGCPSMHAGGRDVDELPVTISRRYVEFAVEAGPTSGRGLQIVTVRLKIQPNFLILAKEPADAGHAGGNLKLELATSNPRTRVDVLYPKGRSVDFGHSVLTAYTDEIAIQALVQRIQGDRTPIEGRVTFRVMGTRTFF